MPSFDTSSEGIRELIRKGESQTVEFKRRLPSQERLAQALAAFANSDGGILLVGVGDRGELFGIPESEIGKTLAQTRRVLRSLFAWSNEIGAVSLDGKTIAYVVVDKAPRAYYPVSTSRGEFFRRENGQLVSASASEFFPTVPAPTTTTPRPDIRVVLFVAMSFREEEEPALVDYFAAIGRAVSESGQRIDVRRVDFLDGDFEISQKVMDEIDNAHIVLADFTLSPHNVYFEVGYARGKRKRIIQTARKETVLQFDVRNWRTVFYRNATELQQKLVPELTAAYREVTSSF
jgi:Schlafen, AlbA_2